MIADETDAKPLTVEDVIMGLIECPKEDEAVSRPRW